MESKIELLKNTNMVDFAMDIYRQIHSTEDVCRFAWCGPMGTATAAEDASRTRWAWERRCFFLPPFYTSL